jgi:Icc-related predicted phosphoesterase
MEKLIPRETKMKTRILLLSDLHLEFHKDWGDSFINSLESSGVDVLVLAGDISTVHHGLRQRLTSFCQKFPHVVYVTGNHEYYNNSLGSTHQYLEEACKSIGENFYWLRNDKIEINGVTFGGGTLWFRNRTDTTEEMKKRLNDFHLIRDFEPFVYEENSKTESFLKALGEEEVDIIVTHYLPSTFSVPHMFKGSSLNRFFVTDLEEIMILAKPKMWFHGHTHSSSDYVLHGTRVVCNPFGYLRFEENPDFNANKIIEINK